MENLYYKHSGRWTLQGIAAGAWRIAAIGIPLAVGCAYGEAYCPYVKGRIFLSVVFVVLLGVTAGGAAVWGNIRSGAAAMAAAAIGVMPSFYTAWALWTYMVVHRNGSSVPFIDLFTSPNLLWKTIMGLGQTGVWQGCIGGSCSVDFGELWMGWGGETLLVWGVPLLFAAGGLGNSFCESCGRWCAAAGNLCMVGTGDEAEMRRRMESKDFGYLAALGAADGDAPARFNLNLESCPGCGGTNTLTVVKTVRGTNQKGQPTETNSQIVAKLLLTASEVQALRAAVARIAAR